MMLIRGRRQLNLRLLERGRFDGGCGQQAAPSSRSSRLRRSRRNRPTGRRRRADRRCNTGRRCSSREARSGSPPDAGCVTHPRQAARTRQVLDQIEARFVGVGIDLHVFQTLGPVGVDQALYGLAGLDQDRHLLVVEVEVHFLVDSTLQKLVVLPSRLGWREVSLGSALSGSRTNWSSSLFSMRTQIGWILCLSMSTPR